MNQPPAGAVALRDVIDADLPILFEHQLDPEATRMAAFPARSHDAFMAHWAKIRADPTVVNKAILLDDELAGSIACFEQLGKPMIGYWLGRSYWGRGVATRALALFLEHLPARPLYAYVAKHNIGSLRVLQKCGFVIRGEDKWSAEANGTPFEEWFLRLDASAEPDQA